MAIVEIFFVYFLTTELISSDRHKISSLKLSTGDKEK